MAGYIGSKVAVVSSGAERKKVFTATSGQTSFTGLSYTVNNVHVFQNGVRLVDGTDYTATNGNSITLTVGAATDDQVVVVSYNTFQTSDTVSASTGGTFAGDVNFTGAFTSQGIDDNASSTAMTLDGSGNLLVGKTSTDLDVVGSAMFSTGQVYHTRSNDTALYLNRLTSDGTILDLRKDGSTVGSIGVEGGNSLYIHSGDTGLRFSDSSDKILPVTTSGSARDNAITLGSSGARFVDLYLSGGVYLGGTGSANKLDDYETGTWTPTLPNGGTLTNQRSTYVKIGNTVTVTTYINSINPTANGSVFFLGGLPFTNVNTSNYYVGGSFGFTGQNNLSDLMPITGVNLDYIYFHENDGQAASVSNNTMRSKGLTGDSGDAMILTITYFT